MKEICIDKNPTALAVGVSDIVRNERRKAKDMLDVMKSANDKLKPKLPNISIFNNTLGEVRGIINKQKNRKYKPRELTEITYGNNNAFTNT
ncbi:hypothetical protein MHB40_14365 [Lysinibacillus sp. FSL K6-0057]|uniref:hypothetical protein n=1 Tax=Lysinibacillus sp. FSL K6-0057 TaxID=2921411 RepID=UPI003159A0CE